MNRAYILTGRVEEQHGTGSLKVEDTRRLSVAAAASSTVPITTQIGNGKGRALTMLERASDNKN
jgi:hypothetical protein